MPSDSEVDAGLKLLNQVVRGTGKLELREARWLHEILSYSVVIGPKGGPGSKNTRIILPMEFLSDLPHTPAHSLSATMYARRLAGRMANTDPMNFYCRAAVPIHIECEWPRQPVRDSSGTWRAASFLRMSITDLRKPGTVCRCAVIITMADDIDLENNPFRLEVALVTTVRRAVDEQSFKFFPLAKHPVTRQELPLDLHTLADNKDADINRFIAGKVYWLGFRQGDKGTKVWIGDDEDADYLSTTTPSLIQAAQILEAQKMIVLDSSQQYASAGEALLTQSGTFEPEPLSANVGDFPRKASVGPHNWDAFICHASEDKDDFVRPLAEQLQKMGLRIWYDEFTLRVGDDLRRAIDHGLAKSRYGIVVLSPFFFRKEWPQKELDGLVAKEVAGKKVILPVWHNVTAEAVRKYSPTLALKVAAKSSEGMAAVVTKLVAAIEW